MQPLFFIVFFFLLLLFMHQTLSKPSLSPNRRTLHEPFVPLSSLPPSEAPNPPPHSPPPRPPPNTKYPFSSTTSTTSSTTTTTTPPNQAPFFPTYPSPPPPPSPFTYASFPANISSLQLPQPPKHKSSSSKLVAVTVVAVAFAVVAVCISAFVYFRRKRYSSDDKTLRSESSLRLFSPVAETAINGSRKVRHASSTSSEFLYLGTVVNSRGVENCHDSHAIDDGGGGGGALDPRRMDSPELQPLPPLARETSARLCGVARDDVRSTTTAEDEDEEFYSPRGSLGGGRESSSGTGSGSRRVFSAIAAESFVGRSSESSSGSFSSSNSGSPDRSHSISLSPPVSLSPGRAQPKSPETTVAHDSPPSAAATATAVALQPPSLPLQPQNETMVDNGRRSLSSSALSSPETTVLHGPPSPPLLPASLPPQPQNETWVDDGRRSLSLSMFSSPERNQVFSPSLSPVHNNQHVQCSSMASSCSSPERGLGQELHTPPLSPLSLSPSRDLEKYPVGAVRESGVSFEKLQSCSSSPMSSSTPGTNILAENARASPEKTLEKNAYTSPRLSNASPETNFLAENIYASTERNLEKNAYASPEKILEKNEDASPRLSNASNGSGKSLSSSSAFSLPSSPEKAMHHSLEQSPRISNVSDRYRQLGLSSLPLSPTLLSSPERELDYCTSNQSAKVANSLYQDEQSPAAAPLSQRKHWDIPVLSTPFGQSATVDNVLGQIAEPSAPPPMPQRKHWEIPVLSTPIGQSLRVSPPSPPPPPPPPPPPQSLQRQRRHWEVPAPSTPVAQTISRPPELIPPSRPFVLQNLTTKVSPVELPPSSQNLAAIEETSKPKLKPLHWDKVRASSDREMVWDQLRSSSFKLNEEMIETLFVVNTPNPKPKDTAPRSVIPPLSQEDRVLDPKKSQNISILLRALNVTIEEVCEALLEGSADTLGTELLESLLKMAPSKEEERKLKEHKDDSPTKLGPAEKFLKALLDVPFAFKRVEAMLYIANFESEVEYLRKSFETLEAACEELRNSRMFLKLLEAVLKTGNRMNVGTNRGDALAFKLDTLLKLVDVKGADGKTTLLHFVVQEIIRSEGARLCGTDQTPSTNLSEDAKCRRIGLQVVSSLSSELANVKKSAAMDSEVLSSDVSKLSKGIANIKEVVQVNKMAGSADESSQKFAESMNKFMRMAEEEILKIQAQESVASSLVKEITEYFHGNLAKEEAHPFRIFMVVRDFLTVLDRVCKEVGMVNERTMVSSAHKFPVPVNPMLPQTLPGLHVGRQYNSSDDESPSP